MSAPARATMPLPQTLEHIDDIYDRYDAFVFDLWGVLHNGIAPYPGALRTLQELRKRGKKTGILSNSPRSAAEAGDHIRKFDLTPDLYDTILTSGQMTYEALRDRDDDWLKKLGTRALHIGQAHDRDSYADIGLTFTEQPGEASFILNTGTRILGDTLEMYDALLAECLRYKLPMLCANPDTIVMRGDAMIIAAGVLAEDYIRRGGNARIAYGKPYLPAYERIQYQLGITPDRCVMIGDNLATDIAGARNAGWHAVWVLEGIHRLDLKKDGPQGTDKIATTLTTAPAQPDYVIQIL